MIFTIFFWHRGEKNNAVGVVADFDLRFRRRPMAFFRSPPDFYCLLKFLPVISDESKNFPVSRPNVELIEVEYSRLVLR